jgi:hypothetical protein
MDMVPSIGSSLGYDYNPAAKPTAGLDAQIARHKKELSDCVNCESAKTTKGKAKIQAISDQIAALTAQAEKAAKPKGTDQPATLAGTPPSKDLFRAGHTYDIVPGADLGFGPVGKNLNVFA